MNSQKGQSVRCPSWKCSKSSKIFSQKTVLRYFKRQMSCTTMLYCMLYCIYIYIRDEWIYTSNSSVHLPQNIDSLTSDITLLNGESTIYRFR
jgi:hypothetical protein